LMAAGLALSLSGCSTVNSMTGTVGGWFGAGPAKAKPADLVEFKPFATLTEAWKGDTGDAGNYLLRPQAEGEDVFALREPACDFGFQHRFAVRRAQAFTVNDAHVAQAIAAAMVKEPDEEGARVGHRQAVEVELVFDALAA